MSIFLRRAWWDLRANRFLNILTVVTMALGVLIVSAYALFLVNVNGLLNTWQQGMRMMIYLEGGLTKPQILDLKHQISRLARVQELRYIPREEAMSLFREQMKRQASLLDHLKDNPLPDAIEVLLQPSEGYGQLEALARRVEALPPVDEVEYGQKWLGRVVYLFDLFRVVGYGMGVLFFMAMVFIVANTIRIVLYARRDEIEIMRMVGASDGFIKGPLFIEGLIQGTMGGLGGLLALYLLYRLITAHLIQGLEMGFFQARFLPPGILAGMLLGSMLVGLLGCYLSLKQCFRT